MDVNITCIIQPQIYTAFLFYLKTIVHFFFFIGLILSLETSLSPFIRIQLVELSDVFPVAGASFSFVLTETLLQLRQVKPKES